jgi:hypothetical protein
MKEKKNQMVTYLRFLNVHVFYNFAGFLWRNSDWYSFGTAASYARGTSSNGYLPQIYKLLFDCILSIDL